MTPSKPGMVLILVAAMPPPITGQASATQMLVKCLERRSIVHVIVDTSRPFAKSYLRARSPRRAIRLFRLFTEAYRQGRRVRSEGVVMYLQLGQSRAAMYRDFLFTMLAKALRWPLVVHIHGGGYRNIYDNADPITRVLARWTLRRARRVLILSDALRPMVDGLVSHAAVGIVENGVAVPQAGVGAKQQGGKLRILFLSNLYESKGYLVVLSCARLCHEEGLDYEFTLAGALTEETPVHPVDFIERHNLSNVRYVGVALGREKEGLLLQHNVMVLPTAYPYEGQPIAVLEGLAYGLCVVATGVGAISATIVNGVTGVRLEEQSAAELLRALKGLIDPAYRQQLAAGGRELYESRHTEQRHCARMLEEFALAWGDTKSACIRCVGTDAQE